MSQPPILSPTAPASPSDETQSTDSSMQFNDTRWFWLSDPPNALKTENPQWNDDTVCLGLQDYDKRDRKYVLRTYTHLDLLFSGSQNFTFDGVLVYTADLQPQVLLDGKPCSTETLGPASANCHRISANWPLDSNSHNLSISVHAILQQTDVQSVSTQFSLAIINVEGEILYDPRISSGAPPNDSSPTQNSPSNSVTSTISTTAQSATAAASAPTVGPTFSSSLHTARPSKARIIVPCVVVPVVVILLIALAAYFWRRRTRAKMAPSAAFKMENPTFTPGETWVPIDEKRAFSPGPTKVGGGSSL